MHNWKSHTGFLSVPKSVTLNDLEGHNDRDATVACMSSRQLVQSRFYRDSLRDSADRQSIELASPLRHRFIAASRMM